MAVVPTVRPTRRKHTPQDRWELREEYAFCGSVAEAFRRVNENHHDKFGNPVPANWVDLTYAAAVAAKRHDARIGPCDDWDVQAPNIRRRVIEQAEKSQGRRAIKIIEKHMDRLEATVSNPGFVVRGSIATEVNTNVKTVRLLAEKSTEITGIGDVAVWWNGLSPQQQRDELSKLGVDVSQFDEPEADSAGSGDGGDSENAEP